MLDFNQFGNLFSSKNPIPSTLEVLNEKFAWNNHRKNLLKEFHYFVDEFKIVTHTKTILWLNGSFVTTKVYPNDIDLVLFIDTAIYQANFIFYKNIRSKYTNIDSYFIEIFPIGHTKYQHGEFDKLEFWHLFSKDRIRRSKGFIELIIN